MKTPAGKECKHYYEDFHRGRNVQECRLVKGNIDSIRWHPSDCSKCPVPDILLANADPDMELTLTIEKGFLGFGRKLIVTAKSLYDGTVIEDPYVGNVDNKNPGLDIFRQALDDINDD
ncbi:MAG: hypothetical protein WBC91_04320 [Phototrophicaceae bacterium]